MSILISAIPSCSQGRPGRSTGDDVLASPSTGVAEEHRLGQQPVSREAVEFNGRDGFVPMPPEDPPTEAVLVGQAKEAHHRTRSDLPVFAAGVITGQIVADIGCGSGRISLQLAEAAVPARYLHDVGVHLDLGRSLSAGVEVKNVGDQETFDVARFPLPGRSIVGRMIWTF